MTSKGERIESQQVNKETKKIIENKYEEKRDREITFIHTGGQTGPRWRASFGKSGPKIPVFYHAFPAFSPGDRNFSRQRLVPFYRKARRRRRGVFLETQSPLKSLVIDSEPSLHPSISLTVYLSRGNEG